MTKRIYLDAGHGGYDSGAVGYVKESAVNIKVVEYMSHYLQKNYPCEVYKDTTSNDSLVTICNRANKWKADLFVSVHFNAGGGDGYEALVYSAANKKLGECFAKHVKAIGQNLRSPAVKYRPDLIVLNSTNMQAILNECAFVDNKKDIQDWDENAELKKMGEALAMAAAEWLGMTKKPVKTGTVQHTFIKEVQKACGATVDGIAGPETLSKTVTVSASKNRTHKVVKAIQTYLNAKGYNCGTVDGIAGPKFTEAVKKYQKAKGCVADGEITAKEKTWKKLLGLS